MLRIFTARRSSYGLDFSPDWSSKIQRSSKRERRGDGGEGWGSQVLMLLLFCFCFFLVSWSHLWPALRQEVEPPSRPSCSCEDAELSLVHSLNMPPSVPLVVEPIREAASARWPIRTPARPRTVTPRHLWPAGSCFLLKTQFWGRKHQLVSFSFSFPRKQRDASIFCDCAFHVAFTKCIWEWIKMEVLVNVRRTLDWSPAGGGGPYGTGGLSTTFHSETLGRF